MESTSTTQQDTIAMGHFVNHLIQPSHTSRTIVCIAYVSPSPRSEVERDIKPRNALAPGRHHYCNGTLCSEKMAC